MMNLFPALDRKLWNELVRFEKPCAMQKELEILAISLKKILTSIEMLSQKPNPTSGQNRKPQSQRSDVTLDQKQKLKEGKQAGPKGLTNLEEKKPCLRCYNCDKTGHIAKKFYASKKKNNRKSSEKDGGQ